jgi:hypothetical protein
MTKPYSAAEAELKALLEPTGISVRISPIRSSDKYYTDPVSHTVTDMSHHNGTLMFSFWPSEDTVVTFSAYYPPLYYKKYVETVTLNIGCCGRKSIDRIRNRLREDSHTDMVLTAEQTRIVEAWCEKNTQRWYEVSI